MSSILSRIVGGFLIVVAVLSLVAGARLLVRAPLFAATARVKLYLPDDQPDHSGYDDGRFCITSRSVLELELDSIRSDAFLSNVVRQLASNANWSAGSRGGPGTISDDFVALIQRRLELKPTECAGSKGVWFVEIRFEGANPREATDVANAIADEYLMNRPYQRKEQAEERQDMLMIRCPPAEFLDMASPATKPQFRNRIHGLGFVGLGVALFLLGGGTMRTGGSGRNPNAEKSASFTPS